jgi:hypothetical protein
MRCGDALRATLGHRVEGCDKTIEPLDVWSIISEIEA